MKGRKPKPTAIKQLEGTYRLDRANPNELQADPLVDLPACPDWLNEYGQDEWYTVVTWLHSVGLLSQIDVSIIAAYCQSMGAYREAERELMANGRTTVTDRGFEMISPWVTIGKQALQSALKIATEYGLTPSARGRMSFPAPKKEESGLQKLIAKRNQKAS